MLLIFWLHFFWCLIPSWQDGVYYSYGWLVAPIALGFAWRRHREIPESRIKNPEPKHRTTEAPKHRPSLWLVGLYLVLIVPLRFVEIGDPTWRIPIWIHALLLLGLTSFILLREGGWMRLRWFLPVMVFAMTAVPLPWQIEQAMVRRLTGTVTEMTQEAFLLKGVPVERAGETLHLGGDAVEVGDACSGIRSLQSLFMAALFFGELLWLGVGRRVILIGVAGLCAFVTNTGRAYYLADVQFSSGKAAADAAHDMAGHLAFALSCLILFLAAKLMTLRRRKTVVRRSEGLKV